MRGTKAAHRVGESSSAGSGAALAIIDSTLESCAHRSFLTQREAIEAMARARDAVQDPALSAMAASITDDAMLSFRNDQLVDRWRLLDPLLDIRRALSP